MQPIIPLLKKEFMIEAATLRKFLELVPEEKFDWKPHEKNMTIKQLTTHLAEIPGWVDMALHTEGLDFAGGYQPTAVSGTKDLLSVFDNMYQKSLASLDAAKEEELNGSWVLRTGDVVHMTLTKYETIRHAIGQMIHHRAQLGVYFRLLGIALPETYGPSADSMAF